MQKKRRRAASVKAWARRVQTQKAEDQRENGVKGKHIFSMQFSM